MGRARGVKFTVTKEQREQVLKKIHRDTTWLKSKNLMDYSLLVSVKEGQPGSFKQQPRLPCQQALVDASDDGKNEIATCVGIIDYLQKWNTGKVIANMIKVLERNKATIKPEPYGDRFYEHFKRSFVAK